jgi:hypothetical protein
LSNKNVNPVTAAIVIGVVALLAVFFLWRKASPPSYSGPPADMGALMKGGGAPPGGTNR